MLIRSLLTPEGTLKGVNLVDVKELTKDVFAIVTYHDKIRYEDVATVSQETVGETMLHRWTGANISIDIGSFKTAGNALHLTVTAATAL